MATWPWCLEKKPWNMFDLPKCVMNVMVETHLDYKSSRRKNPSYKAAYWSRTSSVQEAPFQDILSKTGCFPLKHDIGRVKRKPPHKNPRSVPQHFSATFSPSFCAMFSTALCLGRGFLLCKRKGPLKVFETYGFLGGRAKSHPFFVCNTCKVANEIIRLDSWEDSSYGNIDWKPVLSYTLPKCHILRINIFQPTSRI